MFMFRGKNVEEARTGCWVPDGVEGRRVGERRAEGGWIGKGKKGGGDPKACWWW
jgi:hypothetical protein